ncbi:MAG TPA: RyR domain-containing protein [Gemmatimonadales bacterium]|jgi:hypothetical protein|nr:RyR domain-containing protein [Gemmatimonadales bacterium]
MKTILVTGDLIRDYNLVRSPRAPTHYHETVPHTLLQECGGGAWYLRDLIALACSDLESRIVAPDPQSPNRKAYTIWSPHPRVRGEKSEVWRVEQFLGCEPPPEHSTEAPRYDQELLEPDVLVLDDLALDFRARPELWPAAVREARGAPGAILLKQSAPLAEGALWGMLLERFADRLTVLVSVNSLRARAAAISDSLSWDLSIEETVRELEARDSALDLGHCCRVLVQFGGAGVASFSRGEGDRARFERFLYHPEELEGDWDAKSPGRTFGAQSILMAAVTRHACDPASYPLWMALGRGLAALRKSHETGGGAARFSADAAHASVAAAYHPAAGELSRGKEPAAAFFTAFPHQLLADPTLREQPADYSDLVRDLAGVGSEFLAAKATEVVRRGPAEALAAAPKARYGQYLTVDREEIERINSIRGLMLSYQENPQDRRPLSLAVFGQPGSGKSFAIKQLAGELFGQRKPLEFNLAQFENIAELHAAFHQVRDASLLGQIPLVFWDEFDSGGLRWLKPFLAPMQDAEFREESRVHHLGRAIFVFAGGTCVDFESFDRTSDRAEAVREEFKQLKGPDFVSRLRGSLNIKGPNPGDQDPAYLIRRAILLRALLERHFPHLIDPDTRQAAISTSVIRGFLRVEKYLHGARSLEMVVSSSRPGPRFEPSALPGPEVLRSHVTPDFRQQVAEGELEQPVIEALAEACHAGWYRMRHEAGWRFGAPRDDAGKLHPMLRPYAELSEPEKERNRVTARLTNAKLLAIGYRIAKFTSEDQRVLPELGFTQEERTRLMEIEHDIWLREHLLRGYGWARSTNDALRLHRALVPFQEQLPEDRVLDEAIVDAIPPTLLKRQYKLVRVG